MTTCPRCHEPMDTSEKRGCRKYCLECAREINIERTLERYHKADHGWHLEPDKQNAMRYWELTAPPPGQEDLKGIHLTFVDFKYGDYRYLAGAVMVRGGKEYIFDGRKARRKE